MHGGTNMDRTNKIPRKKVIIVLSRGEWHEMTERVVEMNASDLSNPVHFILQEVPS